MTDSGDGHGLDLTRREALAIFAALPLSVGLGPGSLAARTWQEIRQHLPADWCAVHAAFLHLRRVANGTRAGRRRDPARRTVGRRDRCRRARVHGCDHAGPARISDRHASWTAMDRCRITSAIRPGLCSMHSAAAGITTRRHCLARANAIGHGGRRLLFLRLSRSDGLRVLVQPDRCRRPAVHGKRRRSRLAGLSGPGAGEAGRELLTTPNAVRSQLGPQVLILSSFARFHRAFERRPHSPTSCLDNDSASASSAVDSTPSSIFRDSSASGMPMCSASGVRTGQTQKRRRHWRAPWTWAMRVRSIRSPPWWPTPTSTRSGYAGRTLPGWRMSRPSSTPWSTDSGGSWASRARSRWPAMSRRRCTSPLS